jgi:predicted NBD/HSP70 family sugar kinase
MSEPVTPIHGISVAERKKALPRRGGDRMNPLKEITQRNQQRVFEELVMTRDPAAKDLHEITGLAPSTIGGIVKLFSGRGLIRIEKPGRGARGRQPSPLRVNRQGLYIAGVEILRDEVHGLVTNLCGESVTQLRRVSTDTGASARQPVDPDRVVDAVRELVEQLTGDLIEAEGDDVNAEHPLLGLGVEIGGYVDGHSGTVMFSPNLRWGRAWTDPVPLRQRLRDATRLHTVVDNDVNALAIAQRWFGEGRKTESYAVIYLAEDGIGGALFYQGEIVRGATGKVAEVGHQIVAPRSAECRCGGRGCLEAVAPADKIVDSLRAGTLAKAQQRAAGGDKTARAAFVAAGQAMGRAVVNLSVVADPGAIIFTGGGKVINPAEAGGHRNVILNDDFHQAMCDVVQSHPMCADVVDSFTVVADENEWNGPRGAATLVIRDAVGRVAQDARNG